MKNCDKRDIKNLKRYKEKFTVFAKIWVDTW